MFHRDKRDGGWQAWCASCKTEWRRLKTETEPYKKCAKCKRKKLRISFYQNAANVDGLASMCKPCVLIGKRSRDLQRYGITVEQYEQMSADQGGECAICQKKCPSGKVLAVDHNHKTGNVRALLCVNCNLGLGNFQDNIDLLFNAISYLNSFSDERVMPLSP
jgi:hypothetical protein